MAIYDISQNGQQITIARGLKNNSTIALTGTTLSMTVPTGISVVSVVPRNAKGTYSPSTKVWTVGNIAVGEEAYADYVFEITDKSQAYTYTYEGAQYFGFQITFVAASNESPDINLANNTKYVNITVSGACATQPSNYYCPPVNNFAIPSPCVVDDPYQNITGNVAVNDTACGQGCTTTYALVSASEVNCVINAFDTGNGNFNITVVDALSDWSFQYTESCSGCPSGSSYGPFGPATVSGEALFQGATISNYVQGATLYSTLSYASGIYTFTPPFGSAVTFYDGLLRVTPVTKTADATLTSTELWARIDASSNDVELTLPVGVPVGHPVIIGLKDQSGAFVGTVTSSAITGYGTTYTFANVGDSVTFKHVGSGVWDVIG